MIPDHVMAIAQAHADRDRDTLARLIAAGKVERGGPHSGSRFVADIENRVNVITGFRPVNLAIRPKRGRSKKGKR